MKTSTTTRTTALVMPVLPALRSVHLVANHVLPEAPASELTQATSHG